MKHVILFSLLVSGSLYARLPKAIPLMPPRDRGNAVQNNNRLKISETANQKKLLANIELGTLLRNDGTSSDILGMQMFLGARASLRFSILSPSLFIKPSLGYFFKKQSEGSVSVFQHVIEGGLTAQYAVINHDDFEWLLGVSNRVDLNISTISVYNQSSSGRAFRYRLGPSCGFQFRVTPSVRFTTDFEGSVSMDSSRRVFGSMTTGLAFEL